MGPRLCGLYTDAGLPMPRLLFEASIAGGPDNRGWGNVVSAAVPLMEKLGVATRADVDPATTDRLVAGTADVSSARR
jgi:hypothetical protein